MKKAQAGEVLCGNVTVSPLWMHLCSCDSGLQTLLAVSRTQGQHWCCRTSVCREVRDTSMVQQALTTPK